MLGGRHLVFVAIYYGGTKLGAHYRKLAERGSKFLKRWKSSRSGTASA